MAREATREDSPNMDTYCGICGSLDHDTGDHTATCDHDNCLWPGECQDYTAPMTETEHIAAAYAELGL